MGKKVIITGSTGMVGKGVLLECLEDSRIEKVLVVNRSTLGMNYPKLEEVILKDYSNVKSIADKFRGYDACFYCMGVSSVGVSESQYKHLTFDLASKFVDVMHEKSPEMVFNYVSGTGTDADGRMAWARIKGATENYAMQKGFKDFYAFRPGAIIPEKGIKSRTSWYQWIYILMTPFNPLLKRVKSVTTTTKIGQAMINSMFANQSLKQLEGVDINALAAKG